MAKSSFNSVTGAAKKSSLITLDDLKGLKNPYEQGSRNPFKHDANAEFEGFAKVSWTSKLNGVEYSGEYMGIKFKGIKDALSLSTFLKVDNDARDENNKIYTIQNDSEGIVLVMESREELSLELLQDIEKFFESPRKFKLKPYMVETSWGKHLQKYMINII